MTHSLPYLIRQVAVIGAGTMGAAIAAHLANAGLPVLLLDIAPDRLTSQEELYEARQEVLKMVAEGYVPPAPAPLYAGAATFTQR